MYRNHTLRSAVQSPGSRISGIFAALQLTCKHLRTVVDSWQPNAFVQDSSVRRQQGVGLLDGQQSLQHGVLAALNARQTCSCAATAEPRMKPVMPPQPGTVTPYMHHVMIRIPQPVGQLGSKDPIWWPPIMEKHPALLQAFSAVAASKPNVVGTVKVTAFEHMEVLDRSGDQSRVDMLLFPAGVYYNKVPHDKIQDIVAHHIQDMPEEAEPLPSPSLGKKSSQGDFRGVGLFVCTHGSRDTRCGQVGVQVARRLQQLVDDRGLDAVRVYQASHVGGHKFAGNVLVYGAISPCDGDWFGGITPDNAGRFLDKVINMEIGVDGGVHDAFLRQFWRGRMCMSKEDQVTRFQNPEALQEEEFEASESDTSSGTSTSSSSTD